MKKYFLVSLVVSSVFFGFSVTSVRAVAIVLDDPALTFRIDAVPNSCFSDDPLWGCGAGPEFVNYNTSSSFSMGKINVVWSNNGGNNCDGVGHVMAIITSSAATSTVIATSTNAIYMGCVGFSLRPPSTGEFDFPPATSIPQNFYLSLTSPDGMQGGADVVIRDVVISGEAEGPREPVVIVPGIMGSALDRASDNGEIWPNPVNMLFSGSDSYLDDLKLSTAGVPLAPVVTGDIIRTELGIFPFYEPLITSLEAAGYQESSTLFVAPYDWRMSAASSAAEIAPVLARAEALSPDGKINVIAHSMGGLVMKEYLANGGASSTINKLILAGVPQLGAPKAFKLLDYGDDMGLNFFGIGLNQDETKNIAANMPGVYDLLPSRRYVDVNGGYVKDFRNGQTNILGYDAAAALVPNSAMRAGADTLHQAIDSGPFSMPASNIYNLMGCTADTLGEVDVYDGGKFGVGFTDGDGTVPLTSAFNFADGYHDLFAAGVSHTGLVQDGVPLGLITAILGTGSSSTMQLPAGIGTSLSGCFPQDAADQLMVTVSGPAELNIYDEANRHTGPNDASGTIETQIPSSSFEMIGANDFAVLPADHTYHVVAQAVATGTIDLETKTTRHLIPEKKSTYLSVPIMQPGEKATLDIVPAATSTVLHLDTDADGVPDATLAPTAVLDATTSVDTDPPLLALPILPQDPILNTTTTFIFSSRDVLSGIASMKATLNGVEVVSGQAISLDHLGTNILHLEAKDNAGNPVIGEETFIVQPPAVLPPPPNPSSTPPLLPPPATSTVPTTTVKTISFLATADTYIREEKPNKNQGTEHALRVRNAGNDRTLVNFEDAALRKAVGTSTVISAKLQFTIAADGNNWGKGRELDLLRMGRAWTEHGATWHCANDTIPANAIANCPGNTWDMAGHALPFASSPSASTTITNKMGGIVTFDVTRDLRNIILGVASADDGWILKKTDEKVAGLIEFASRETASGPKLIVQYGS